MVDTCKFKKSRGGHLLAPGRLYGISKWGGHLRLPNFDQ